MYNTENDHSIGNSFKDGEEEAADDAGAEDLEEKLAPGGEILGGGEREVSVYQHEEDVTPKGGWAGKETVRLLAGLKRRTL